jgi:hypothetical protein
MVSGQKVLDDEITVPIPNERALERAEATKDRREEPK